MNDNQIDSIIKILKKVVKEWKVPIVTEVSWDRSPYKVLISCLLSLRTKDDVTREASKRLFSIADTPDKMLKVPKKKIEKAIYPVGFYKTKAERILGISKTLVDKYKSGVPDEIDELLKLKGVGRKTANLVVTLGFNKPGICVDTHVHRISNRLGYVHTRTPDKTEFALREKLPKKHWIIYNDLLVTYGQNICKPISPLCSKCPIEQYCDKIGVTTSR